MYTFSKLSKLDNCRNNRGGQVQNRKSGKNTNNKQWWTVSSCSCRQKENSRLRSQLWTFVHGPSYTWLALQHTGASKPDRTASPSRSYTSSIKSLRFQRCVLQTKLTTCQNRTWRVYAYQNYRILPDNKPLYHFTLYNLRFMPPWGSKKKEKMALSHFTKLRAADCLRGRAGDNVDLTGECQ